MVQPALPAAVPPLLQNSHQTPSGLASSFTPRSLQQRVHDPQELLRNSIGLPFGLPSIFQTFLYFRGRGRGLPRRLQFLNGHHSLLSKTLRFALAFICLNVLYSLQGSYLCLCSL